MKGQIRKALSGFYYIYANGETFQTRARGNFRNKNITPLVGDEGMFTSDNQTDGYLLEIFPRKNELVRPPVANVDQGVIVMSMVTPKFSYRLLDRFLVTLEEKEITPIIYLTKIDLVTEQEMLLVREVKQIYKAIGYSVIAATQKGDVQAIRTLEHYFSERLTVFIGQSGAGKSTLLNEIAPYLELATNEISTSLGRGKHTTRHVELLPLANGLVADTPGFSAVDFLEMEAADLTKQFPEFVAASHLCKFRACLHHKEPQCGVKKQVERGVIARTRYDNYLQFLAEIEQRKPVYKKK